MGKKHSRPAPDFVTDDHLEKDLGFLTASQERDAYACDVLLALLIKHHPEHRPRMKKAVS